MSQLFLQGINANELLESLGQLIQKRLEKVLAQINHPTKPKFLTRKEVAKILNITLGTLNDWTKLGWIQCYKVGRRVLYKESEVFANVEKLALHKNKKGGYHYAA